MKKSFRIVLLLLLISFFAPSGQDFNIPKAKADLNHTQIYPHIKLHMMSYALTNTSQEIKDFIATHYDSSLGDLDLGSHSNLPTQFDQAFYHRMAVSSNSESQYQDARGWAQQNSVDFESFFVHYSENTRACIGTICYDFPAGSRIPAYTWGASGGDLSKDSAVILTNPGNSNFRAWQLNYLEKMFNNKSYLDGVIVMKTNFNVITDIAVPESGGAISEYPTSPATSYGDDMIILFRQFKSRFGENKVQVPNTGPYHEDQTRVNQVYPYIWGVERGDATLFTPRKSGSPNLIAQDIASAEAAGLKNLLRGEALCKPTGCVCDTLPISMLSYYYLINTDSTYLFPLLSCFFDGISIDPRQNQWFEALTYDIGNPVNDPADAAKYKTYYTGIDPSSENKDTINVTNVQQQGSVYTLTDPSKNWTSEQWMGKKVVFPSGYTASIFHSGTNWISIYNPEETPAVGQYRIGDYAYQVWGREYQNALVLFKPKNPALPKDLSGADDATATIENLPATSDNASGRYYQLNQDGTLGPAITSVSLRNTDGAILIKESSLNQVTISKNVDKSSATPGQALTYTIYYSNTTQGSITSVKIEDQIPVGTTLVPDSATIGGSCDNTKCTWILDTLAPGDSGSVQFQVKIE